MRNYATFGQRFAAMCIDGLVFVPLMVAYQGLASVSRIAALVFTVLHAALGLVYTIYCHGRFGKTVGKWAMGIRVVRVTGEPLRWREAWLRSVFDVCFMTVSTLGWGVALISIADSKYYGVGWSARNVNLLTQEPVWAAWAANVDSAWIGSEVVTMLFNKQRRALHDFIAGTVVVSERQREPVPGAAIRHCSGRGRRSEIT